MTKLRSYPAAPHAILVMAVLQFLLLGGCGFHLRGSTPLPPSLSKVYIENEKAALMAEALRRAFIEQQLKPLEEQTEAQVVIRLSRERYQRRVLSVGATGNVQQYELIYSVNLELLDAKNEPIADPQALTVRRELRYESAEVVAKANEEQQLKSEMIDDAARQIFRRLQFVEL